MTSSRPAGRTLHADMTSSRLLGKPLHADMTSSRLLGKPSRAHLTSCELAGGGRIARRFAGLLAVTAVTREGITRRGGERRQLDDERSAALLGAVRSNRPSVLLDDAEHHREA